MSKGTGGQFESYYTEQEMARLLGISVRTLRNRHCSGKNHPPKTPERLYPKDEFDKWNKNRLQRELRAS
jgi:hypothetical protein